MSSACFGDQVPPPFQGLLESCPGGLLLPPATQVTIGVKQPEQSVAGPGRGRAARDGRLSRTPPSRRAARPSAAETADCAPARFGVRWTASVLTGGTGWGR